ncbi:DMT family transporter [Psychrobacter sp. LV10R520-6]|uniref:DMT family transporter n=1 Tax=Psychrobacter sp. LV10R520-6 TaxID=1415574 RepID=UPI0024C9CF3E|nr:EamA family transporter [Psychrobacter sp. LV10R520-6]SNT70033.1 EamA-like transporter family protein [Psychrobacter sp. LV10R520-6]
MHEKQNFNNILGFSFALVAAALNATIGIFSVLLMNTGLKSNDIAFLKTIIAFILLSALLSKTPRQIQYKRLITTEFITLSNHSSDKSNNKRIIGAVAICAFLGIFTLFVFETKAYEYGNPANVVVILMAAATISATLFGALLLKERLLLNTLIGVLLAVAGIFVISWTSSVNLTLVFFAVMAGSGYGLFSVLMQRFGLQGGIYLTKYLLLFGSLFLFIPFIVTFEPVNIGYQSILGLLGLAIFPTIIGFYCTTSALKYLPASKVQVIELSEPLFAMFFVWLILHEDATMRFWLGAGLVILGILSITNSSKKSAE